jgi:hypothetical protein
MAKCRHSDCGCQVKTEGEVCSEACADIAQDQPCICGHGNCQGVMGSNVNKDAF